MILAFTRRITFSRYIGGSVASTEIYAAPALQMASRGDNGPCRLLKTADDKGAQAYAHPGQDCPSRDVASSRCA